MGVAGGPRMAELVGEHCDGILRLGPLDFLNDEVLPAFDRGARKAGKDPSSLSKMAFVDTSYHPEMAKAVANARLYGGVLIPECYSLVQDPRIIEQRSALVRDDILMGAFAVGSKVGDLVERYTAFARAGFDTLIWAEISPDANLTPRFCKEQFIPSLRDSV